MDEQRAESPKCDKCDLVMCQQFDDVQMHNVTLAIPNGRFKCYRCGAEKEAK